MKNWDGRSLLGGGELRFPFHLDENGNGKCLLGCMDNVFTHGGYYVYGKKLENTRESR